jgi:hypothetical protein
VVVASPVARAVARAVASPVGSPVASPVAEEDGCTEEWMNQTNWKGPGAQYSPRSVLCFLGISLLLGLLIGLGLGLGLVGQSLWKKNLPALNGRVDMSKRSPVVVARAVASPLARVVASPVASPVVVARAVASPVVVARAVASPDFLSNDQWVRQRQ